MKFSEGLKNLLFKTVYDNGEPLPVDEFVYYRRKAFRIRSAFDGDKYKYCIWECIMRPASKDDTVIIRNKGNYDYTADCVVRIYPNGHFEIVED